MLMAYKYRMYPNKELKAKLEQLAKEDCRSLTSFINKILTDYVKDK